MPIDYKEYHPKWSLISRLIRYNRAKNKCEFCGVPNHAFITRDKKGNWRYKLTLNEITSWREEGWNNTEIARENNCTYVVLTVAHLDHDKTHNRFKNLAALCQRCHLKYDIKHHANNRKYGRYHKRDQIPINFEST